MSTQTQAAPQNEAVLIEKVSYPVFFEKLAAAAIVPTSPASADTLIKLAHQVGVAVSASVNRYLDTDSRRAEDAIKAAADSAACVAGIVASTAPPETPGRVFLDDAAVKAAAESLYSAQMKAAGLGAVLDPVPPMAKTKEEEEAEEAQAACKK